MELLCLFTTRLVFLNVQYYLRTGTCKFGMSCKFNHPKNAGGSLTNAPLNSYGYPLRPVIICCMFSHIFMLITILMVMIASFLTGRERVLLLFENGAMQIWYNL